jgi:hypothetical protein
MKGRPTMPSDIEGNNVSYEKVKIEWCLSGFGQNAKRKCDIVCASASISNYPLLND